MWEMSVVDNNKLYACQILIFFDNYYNIIGNIEGSLKQKWLALIG